MATNTGYKPDASWTTLQNGVALTQGGTTTDLSGAVSLDTKFGFELAVKAVYSNHALATSGLTVYVLRDSNDAYEAAADLPQAVQPVFTQNNTNRATYAFAGPFSNIKILLSWGNTTGSSAVTVTTSYKLFDIPAASA
jgi:hypothetical protein